MPNDSHYTAEDSKLYFSLTCISRFLEEVFEIPKNVLAVFEEVTGVLGEVVQVPEEV